MKMYPKKSGQGFVTAYTVIIGSAEARRVGFVNEDGTRKELTKEIDEEAGTITIRVAEKAKDE